ncbi:hypothetical protein BDZ91DRAFT_764590 [Kalaharituber pfeilii]|nr:hypothetical protein BDZ91DRAFT_764590 [Kalaharituber pfeilii]
MPPEAGVKEDMQRRKRTSVSLSTSGERLYATKQTSTSPDPSLKSQFTINGRGLQQERRLSSKITRELLGPVAIVITGTILFAQNYLYRTGVKKDIRDIDTKLCKKISSASEIFANKDDIGNKEENLLSRMKATNLRVHWANWKQKSEKGRLETPEQLKGQYRELGLEAGFSDCKIRLYQTFEAMIDNLCGNSSLLGWGRCYLELEQGQFAGKQYEDSIKSDPELEGSMVANINELRAEIKADTKELRNENKADMKNMSADIVATIKEKEDGFMQFLRPFRSLPHQLMGWEITRGGTQPAPARITYTGNLAIRQLNNYHSYPFFFGERIRLRNFS